ncbi:MAG: hypothetical protein Q9169_000085, partial [Polycauliona sp. 2 TL-2023]
MAIFSTETTGPANGPQPSIAAPVDIEAWTEQATESINAIAMLSSAPVRGTSVSLAIPLDEQAAKRTDGEQHLQDPSVASRQRREPLRRDSLKRREALLRGKEGSRRRQRWEN